MREVARLKAENRHLKNNHREPSEDKTKTTNNYETSRNDKAEEENEYKKIMNKVKRFITNFKQRYETPWNTPKDTSSRRRK